MKKIISEDIRSDLNKMKAIIEKSGDPEDETKDIVQAISNLDTKAPNIQLDDKFGQQEIAAVIATLIKYFNKFAQCVQAYEHALSLSGAKKVVGDMHPSIEELKKYLKDAFQMAQAGQLESISDLYNAIFNKMSEFETGFNSFKDQINNQWKANHLSDYEKFTKTIFKALKQMPENIQHFKKKLDVVRHTDFHKTHSHAKVGRNVQPMI
jgi:archaellum component FlaC